MLNKVFEVLNDALEAKDSEIDYLRWKVAELERKYEGGGDIDGAQSDGK